MATVAVLLSTYNGAPYLREQLESLLRQTDVDIYVNVRDDGSTDATLSILKEYADSDSRISIEAGENLGFAMSFLSILKNCKDTDYYAFCDQDDVWDEDKLSRAVEQLQKVSTDLPAMYYSNLRVVDSNLSYLRMSHAGMHIQKNKYSALIENMATGCTVVFNRAAAELVRSRMPNTCQIHDWWVYLVCRFFGITLYDPHASISYRQHVGNVIGTYGKKKTIAIYASRARRLFKLSFHPYESNAKNFLNCYGDMMNSDDRVRVNKLAHYKISFVSRLRLFFDCSIHATSLSREIRYRILVIMGIA